MKFTHALIATAALASASAVMAQQSSITIPLTSTINKLIAQPGAKDPDGTPYPQGGLVTSTLNNLTSPSNSGSVTNVLGTAVNNLTNPNNGTLGNNGNLATGATGVLNQASSVLSGTAANNSKAGLLGALCGVNSSTGKANCGAPSTGGNPTIPSLPITVQ